MLSNWDYRAAESTDWFTAEASCRDAGGHLPSIHSDMEEIALTNYMSQLNSQNIWIGGNDLTQEVRACSQLWDLSSPFNNYADLDVVRAHPEFSWLQLSIPCTSTEGEGVYCLHNVFICPF